MNSIKTHAFVERGEKMAWCLLKLTDCTNCVPKCWFRVASKEEGYRRFGVPTEDEGAPGGTPNSSVHGTNENESAGA